ncbi:hypothetical protein HY418_03110 [Candidatus Kaiserbacteria bacterium]|nr:hypothetical protein [Candidatus Kaiserbacteria bacterium]
MERTNRKRNTRRAGATRAWFVAAGVGAILISCGVAYAVGYTSVFGVDYYAAAEKVPPPPKLDTAAYDLKLLQVAYATTTISTTTIAAFGATSTATSSRPLWPVKTVYPNYGAILPFKRIVAYYGNFLSTRMGVLGEYPADEMLQRLSTEVATWEAADPSTPVVPAIHYIAVTAQESAGKDGKYRARMSDSQIDHALELARRVDGIVFLDIQVGLSDLPSEVPLLEKYLKMPQVHLAVDPEFAMQPSGMKPGTVVGTYDAKDINYAANYLAGLVKKYNLPPKVLIIHRYTQDMVTHYKQITPLPEVQIVMDMDGWGSPAKKIGTYTFFIQSEPVQFTGFKLFYKNDIKPPSTRMLTPAEILNLKPQPLYIQYQ